MCPTKMKRIIVYLNERQTELLDRLREHKPPVKKKGVDEVPSRYAVCKDYILNGMRRDLAKVGEEGGER